MTQVDAIETQMRLALQAHHAGDLIQARALYEKVLSAEPEFPEVLYNLALLSISEEKIDLAKKYLEQVLEINPAHLNALNNLGALLVYEKNFPQAVECFQAVLTINAKHHEALNNLATCYLQLGQYKKALEGYDAFLQLKPNDIGGLYSYALAFLELGDFEQAIAKFQGVLALKQDHLDARSNLGIAYLKAGKLDLAQNTFSDVLKLEPNHPIVNYLYAAMTGKNLPARPPEIYVRDLFDHYAKHYEQHMVDILHYKTPQQLRILFDKYSKANKFSIIDLGCGTGLSGLAFADIAEKLIGVDLSEKMLALAKQKNIYNELIQADLIQALKKYDQAFDLLLASDTFNYFGDFKELFLCCSGALKSNGYLLFSVEKEKHNQDWALQNNSRYAHSEHYVRELAQQCNFKVVAIEQAALRMQQHEACQGLLCLLQS